MDGVTYKDWQNFHDLRSRLAEWTASIKNLIVTHPGIEFAETAAQDIEDAAMKIAQAAAKELASIKEVGLWKMATGNLADDFDPAQMSRSHAPDPKTQEDGKGSRTHDDAADHEAAESFATQDDSSPPDDAAAEGANSQAGDPTVHEEPLSAEDAVVLPDDVPPTVDVHTAEGTSVTADMLAPDEGNLPFDDASTAHDTTSAAISLTGETVLPIDNTLVHGACEQDFQTLDEDANVQEQGLSLSNPDRVPRQDLTSGNHS
jgi:hypothetical protein